MNCLPWHKLAKNASIFEKDMVDLFPVVGAKGCLLNSKHHLCIAHINTCLRIVRRSEGVHTA